MKKYTLIVSLVSTVLLNGFVAHAKSAWSDKAVPEKIESIRGTGFMIFGAFGNTGTACTEGDVLFIAIDHPQYDQLFSIAMSALLGGKKIWGYAHECATPGWHGGTFNEITSLGALYIES